MLPMVVLYKCISKYNVVSTLSCMLGLIYSIVIQGNNSSYSQYHLFYPFSYYYKKITTAYSTSITYRIARR